MKVIKIFKLIIIIQLILKTTLISGFGLDDEAKLPPVKSDIPYIKCQVCEQLIKNAHRSIREQKSAEKPGKKVIQKSL